jgi:hypothetical protein
MPLGPRSLSGGKHTRAKPSQGPHCPQTPLPGFCCFWFAPFRVTGSPTTCGCSSRRPQDPPDQLRDHHSRPQRPPKAANPEAWKDSQEHPHRGNALQLGLDAGVNSAAEGIRSHPRAQASYFLDSYTLIRCIETGCSHSAVVTPPSSLSSPCCTVLVCSKCCCIVLFLLFL